ncbi:restriction endonuclease [Natronoflexus pectinivorans]|uniref:ATP cone domain-containing protein n=1 Tax=Natronoflexus pectinivorans TaxID=682526 RepID=A0A4R2GDE1_9BACT|nr:restriction endonuclease [Natronoflexus pectinivorans]TCO06105.1 ATP cone domain-containing protein [Natronoflexus pectinivorans]
MSKKLLIEKASGEMQPFSVEKLEQSLKRSGADGALIQEVVEDVESWLKEGMTTKRIYNRAFSLLRRKRRSMAARYSLKKAIMELGPSGYPFEHFIGQLFKYQGFEVRVGEVLKGHCVSHEMDVIATSQTHQHLVECKFYNSPGKFASVQVPLYIKSRIDDIVRERQKDTAYQRFNFQGWVVTNTRFTTDAIDFGLCSGLKLLGWDFPEKRNLRQLIEEMRIFPITAITQLSKAEKAQLLNQGVVLCRQLLEKPEVLDNLRLKGNKRGKILDEVDDLCHG